MEVCEGLAGIWLGSAGEDRGIVLADRESIWLRRRRNYCGKQPLLWDYLWHKLEIGLMRVGEHIGERPRKSWGVGLHFFEIAAGKIARLLLIE